MGFAQTLQNQDSPNENVCPRIENAVLNAARRSSGRVTAVSSTSNRRDQMVQNARQNNASPATPGSKPEPEWARV